ncbi:glycine--tRNA ligase subunit alpha [Escherichia coli]|nr:glycine--tRNA ligase subunit alpha [Escherichia coli]
MPAYERILKAAHSFNLLDARKAISVTGTSALHSAHSHPDRQWQKHTTASREALGSRCATKISKRRLCLKTFLVKSALKSCHQKRLWLSPLLRILLRSWITLASHTAPFNGLLLRVVWQ